MTYQDIIERKRNIYVLAKKISEAERIELARLREEIETDCGIIGHIFGPSTHGFLREYQCCQICGKLK